jgi:hypothetical protein
MKSRMNTRFVLVSIVIAIIFSATLCPAVFAAENTVSGLTASYSVGKVSVSGTTSQDVHAVAVMLYDTDGTSLLRMESFAISEQSFSADIYITLNYGTYTVKAADYAGGPYASTVFTYASSDGYEESENDDSSSGDTPTTPAKPAYTADLRLTGEDGDALPVGIDVASGTGTVYLEGEKAEDLINSTGIISMPSIPDVDSYELELPAGLLSNSQETGNLTLSTDTASIIIPDNMLSTLPDVDGVKAGISIGPADKSGLTAEEKAAIGDRPLIQLGFTLNDEKTEWSNPDAPVTVSIPYTPSAEELKNLESIVIWYLDGSGRLVCVTSGRYDPKLGTVTFSTTHFSIYAVGYNPVAFNDVPSDTWYSKAVSFIAARSISLGTGSGKYSPENRLTRAEFLVMLMRAYDIKPDTNISDNFDDAGATYYTGYLAAAKRLGISTGVGNNLFAPGKDITRQEMFTLLYRALKIIGMLPANGGGKLVSSFSDAGDIQPWARVAIAHLAETGTITGSGGKLHPNKATTRAEIAQVLFNLLSR